MPRHIIMSHGRSGSNYFAQIINQHPKAVNFGEVLGDWTLSHRLFYKTFFKSNNAASYLDWLYSSNSYFYGAQFYSFSGRLFSNRKTHFGIKSKDTTIGVKEFYVNFRNFGLLDYLIERDDIKIIYLVRENLMQRFLSGQFMGKPGMLKTTDSTAAQKAHKINVDIDKMKKVLTACQKEHDGMEETLGKIPSNRKFNIRYEDYFYATDEVKNATHVSMQEFLGLDPITLTPEHKQVRPHDMRKTIENYAEVSSFLEGTAYQRFLT